MKSEIRKRLEASVMPPCPECNGVLYPFYGKNLVAYRCMNRGCSTYNAYRNKKGELI